MTNPAGGSGVCEVKGGLTHGGVCEVKGGLTHGGVCEVKGGLTHGGVCEVLVPRTKLSRFSF